MIANDAAPTAMKPDHAVERLVFFSDAVFAIAITLLVIELHVPHIARGAPAAEFWIGLANLIPNFVGFFVTFFVIGAFWAGHHRAFGCVTHWSGRLVVPNLMLLCTIAAMPFFTAFSSSHSGDAVPVAVYCFWLFLTALANIRLQRIATSAPVVAEDVSAAYIANVRRRGIAVALGAGTGVVVAILAPYFGQVALVSIPLWRLLLERVGPWRAGAAA